MLNENLFVDLIGRELIGIKEDEILTFDLGYRQTISVPKMKLDGAEDFDYPFMVQDIVDIGVAILIMGTYNGIAGHIGVIST